LPSIVLRLELAFYLQLCHFVAIPIGQWPLAIGRFYILYWPAQGLSKCTRIHMYHMYICIWMDGIITLPAYHYIVIVSFSIYVCSYMPLDHSTRAEFRWWWRWWYLQLLGVVCVIESILFCSVLLVSMVSLWVSRAVRPEMIYLTERGVVLVLLGSVLCYAVAKMASAKLEICQKPLFFRRFNWIVAIKLASE